MEYLSVFLKEQIVALTKADHYKRDVEELLSWFAKKLTNLAVLLIWNSVSLDSIYNRSLYGSIYIPTRIKLCVLKKGKLINY